MNNKSHFRKLASILSRSLTRFPKLHSQLRAAFVNLPASLRGPVIVFDRFRNLALEQAPVFFLQIGANDGDQSDPICQFVKRYKWRGILVEPVPQYFEALKINYAHLSGLVFENIAISDSPEPKKFYYLDDSDSTLPDWARGLGSFYEEEVVSAEMPGKNTRDYLRNIEVPCLSLDALLQKHNYPQVDLLMIDTQGFDGKIIKQINFAKLKPKVIVFEHHLLSPIEKQECRLLLENQGYVLVEDRWDFVAELEQ